MAFHKQGRYDAFDSIREVGKHYRRCRTLKHFILSDKALENDAINGYLFNCAYCGEPLTIERGNRGYHAPGRKASATREPIQARTIVMHYDCSWSQLLSQI